MNSNLFFYKNVLDNLYDGVYFVDMNGVITYWNKGAERITGYTTEAVMGRKCSDNLLMHTDGKGCNLCENGCPLAATKQDGNVREREVFLLHREGFRLPIFVRALPFYNEAGEIIGAVEIFSDNTKQKQQEEKMKHLAKLAFTDVSTDATNRRYGEMKLTAVIEEVKSQGIDAAILLIKLRQVVKNDIVFTSDIDEDTMGVIAKTLLANISEGDTISRWDRNSFLLILRNQRKSTLLLLGEKFRALMLQTKLSESFMGDSLFAAIGGACIRNTDKVQSIVERATQNAQISLEIGGNKISVD